MKRTTRSLLLFAGLLAPLSLFAVFVDKAQSAGVDLNYPTAITPHTLASLDPYSTGGAACACDIDGDGWTDLIVARTGAPCLVFINNHDGTFREEGHARGLDTVSDIGGIAAGDLANKGSVDIFMAPASGPRYYLFVNDGTGHFTEKAVERGADVPVSVDSHLGQSVSLVDYDQDGYLDIYVCEWNVPSSGENAQHSVLLHNRGRSAPGFFENKTAASGLTQPVSGVVSSGYAALWADLDGDGYPDLFLSADYGGSQLWWNNGDGTFTNGTASSGITNNVDAMGAALLDYDGDGKIDIFIGGVTLNYLTPTTTYAPKNLLFRNLGGRHFQEVAVSTGVSQSGWSWGAATLDADNDGWPDLFVTNGFQALNHNFDPVLTDPSTLFINRNGGGFSDLTAQYGITDTGPGRSVTVLDYDNDGREDIFVTQTVGHRILYHNENSAANAHWLALQFRGTVSNRDGYGCQVTVTAGGRSQVAVYNPTNAYIGQREPRLHYGLGASTTVDKISIKWPSGTVQELSAVAANQLLLVTEPGSGGSSTPAAGVPVITTNPRSSSVAKDGALTLTAAAQGSPDPVYNWFKDGVRIVGATGATLTLTNVQPIDQGTYTVTATNQNGTVTSSGATVTVTADLASKSVARWWNEALLDGIRKDTPNPPVHARNLYHLSATLWDSFWAYEANGWTTQHEMFVKETPTLPATESDRLAAQREAMSYAAYTLIKQRFTNSPGAAATLAGIRWLMQQYGFNPDLTDSSGSTPSAVGLRIGQQVLAKNLNDGANEANGYVDATGFHAANPSLVVRNPGVGSGVDPDFWQPLDLVNTITQNGIVLGAATQKFVGSNAKTTKTFALLRRADGFLQDDPGAPPFFSRNKPEYVAEARQVILFSSQLTTADGATIDISPGKMLNNPLGTNDGKGHSVNPVTGQPYASNVVLRGDYGRVLAEFWADGPNSETPPGHWNVLFNQVSDHPQTTHQYMGRGPVLRRLEWDVAGYLVLNGALHDAACAAWTLKWEYNSARPITMIRYLASRGQSSDPAQPSYSPDGLPLEPGLIEVITAASSAPGQRHANLISSIGQIAVKSWLGTPPSATQTAGVGWILGVNWMPYQRETFVTPAFPAYISGHSTFSRAAAEVLSLFTGSEYFPGGLATYNFAAGKGLTFEAGPTQDVQLQWATYADAADQAGLSRLYGGIHISADDFTGRGMGSVVGIDAFTFFTQLYTPPTTSSTTTTNSGTTTTTTTTTPSGTTSSSGGGGGGTPSVGFYLLLLMLGATRMFSSRKPPP